MGHSEPLFETSYSRIHLLHLRNIRKWFVTEVKYTNLKNKLDLYILIIILANFYLYECDLVNHRMWPYIDN